MTVSAILLTIVMLPLTLVAVAAEKHLVKINHVTLSLFVDKKSGRSGDLSSISFSVENAENKPLERVTLRVTARSHDGGLLQTDTFEEDLSKTPLGAKEAKRLTHYMSINGFLIDGKRGSVDVRVIDYRLVPEGGWLNLNTKDPIYVSYFSEIKEAIKQNWKTPEIALRYGLYGTISVEFSISGSGQIEELRVSRSSGSHVLDEEGMRAIRAAAPFPPPNWIKTNPLFISASMRYGPRLGTLKQLVESFTKQEKEPENSPSLEFY